MRSRKTNKSSSNASRSLTVTIFPSLIASTQRSSPIFNQVILSLNALWLLDIQLDKDNEVSGISGPAIKTKQGSISIVFGKGREYYEFRIPVLVPLDNDDVSIIIGRVGFFNQFKITFDESSKKIEFKKIPK